MGALSSGKRNIGQIIGRNHFTKSACVGSYQDVKFDDLGTFLNQSIFPTGVMIHSGDVIDSIELLYGTEGEQSTTNPLFHGGPNGRSHLYKLGPGDFLCGMQIIYGKYPFSLDENLRNRDMIIQIRFATQLSDYKYGPWYGNECGKGEAMPGKVYTIDGGYNNVIVALYGAICKENMVLHNYVQALGVYSLPILLARGITANR